MRPHGSQTRLNARLAQLQQCFPEASTDSADTSFTATRTLVATDAQSQSVQDAISRVLLTLQENFDIEFSAAEMDVIKSVIGRYAVSTDAPTASGNRRQLCLFAAACIVSTAGIPVHMVFQLDETAAMRFREMSVLAKALGIRIALVSSAMSAEQRSLAYGTDIVFISARECALDYLRLHRTQRQDATAIRLRFLRPDIGTSNRNSLYQPDYRETFALIEEIDQILVDAAMTPVHLYGQEAAASAPAESDQDIVAASNYFRTYNGYGAVGGIGEGLDNLTDAGFRHYTLGQTEASGLGHSLPAGLAIQRESRRNQLVVFSASRSMYAQLGEWVKQAVDNGATVIVDRLPENELENIANALKLNTVVVASAELQTFAHTFDYTGMPHCALINGSLANLVESADATAHPPANPIIVFSNGFNDSYRAEQRKFNRVRKLFPEARFLLMLTDDYPTLELPAASVGLLNCLPRSVRDYALTRLIGHKQKEFDRHRARTIAALIKYEKELDDLLAFSG